MYGGQGLLQQIQQQKHPGKALDFSKLVKKIDWIGCDVMKLQQKVRSDEDEEKIKQFHEQRKKYYKQLGPKKGVFKTNENDMKEAHTYGLQTSKIISKQADTKRDKQHEDILHELTNVTQALIPAMEKRQQEIRRQALIRHREEEEKKFEDKTYLKNYFNEMRQQIDSDLLN